MFVKQSKSWKGTFLSFAVGYRKDGKVKHKTIEKIGYLDDLKKLYDDPIAHFKEIAKERTKDEVTQLVIKNINTKIIDNNCSKKNLGYVIIKKLYDELKINEYLKEKENNLKIKYKISSIFKLLIYSRILYPDSKLGNYENKDIFFENFDFTLENIYRSFDYLYKYKDEILSLIWNNTKEAYKRETQLSYYDCTNYYFEISYNDEDIIDDKGKVIKKGTRKKGPSKEHRKTPIVGMGLLMDNKGIPLYYDLYPGNESEKTKLRPSLRKMKTKFDIERTIVVADRGLNTSDNTVFIAGKNDDDHTNHDGYVYGQSIVGADKEFKTWVLNQEGYIYDELYDEEGNLITYKEAIKDENGNITKYEDKPLIFKHKSRIYAKKVQIKKKDKGIVNYQIYQKQMVYYSQKYANKQAHERELAIEKAKDLINNPKKYNQATSYGCTKYINNIKFVEETGEIADGIDLSLKLNKIDEEAKFDGYYSIVTSEKQLSDKEIRDIYKGLWKIEESFKITKSELETRPVYVWTDESIEAHFLSCFVSLVILRLIEQKINRKFSTTKIIEALKNYTSTNIEHDIYLQDFRNDVIKELEVIFNIDLSHKYLTLSQIKKLLNS